MSIKVLSAKLRNYGPISELTCQFFDGVTTLVGLNGSGKSKILESIVSCVKGIAKKQGGVVGDRYRFIGSNGASSDVEFEFLDEKSGHRFFIKNHITKLSNNITIRSDDNAPIGEDWLKSFLNVSLMSATSFSQLSGKEQAELLGIDVSSFDNELKQLKAKATEIRAEIKAFGKIEEVEPVEKIDINALNEKEKALELALNEQYIKNREENERRREKHRFLEKEAEKVIQKWHDEAHKRMENLTIAQAARDRLCALGYMGREVNDFIKTLPEPDQEPHVIVPPIELIELEMPDGSELSSLRQEIADAWENNAKYQEYQQYLRKVEELKSMNEKLEDNIVEQKQCIDFRNNYLSSHDYGFKGLSVDENGELVLSVRGEDSRPLKQPHFSRGEMEMIMAQLHIAMNPEFRVRFIDDFEAIDEPNQHKLLKMLIDNDFQVIVAEVGKQSDRDNVIVITEGKIDTQDNDERPEIL